MSYSSSPSATTACTTRSDTSKARKPTHDETYDPSSYQFDLFQGTDLGLLSSLLDVSAGAATQVGSVAVDPIEYSSSSWYTPSVVDSANVVNDAAPDLYGMSFNEVDFNSMAFINCDPMLLNSMLGALGTATSGSSVSTEPSFPLTGGTTSDPTHLVKLDSASSSSAIRHSPTIKDVHGGYDIDSPFTSQVSATPSTDLTDNSEIEKLTTRARQIVGLNTAPRTDANTSMQFSKLPIPRLHPLTTAQSSSGSAHASPSSTLDSANSRTKLSHSTVERRYRTNMRQHIKTLREVVPALRVLELKPGNRVSNLSLKPGTRRAGVDSEPGAAGDDVVDERGYIDGVKVARNGSKTTAILKTIEYIRVLKHRENRLKHEQEGLRTLVRSFPGGSELLQQWEGMWREKYGGPEKDEVEEGQGEVQSADHRDGDACCTDDGKGYATMSGRDGAKRPKTDASTSGSDKEKIAGASAIETQIHGSSKEPKKYVPIKPAQAAGITGSSSVFTTVPAAKRKRGRPRKAPLPPVTIPNGLVQEVLITQPVAIAPAPREQTSERAHAIMQSKPPHLDPLQETQSAQYLLAMFTFFSFFTSPLPRFSASFGKGGNVPRLHTHYGIVMVERHLESDFEWGSHSSTTSSNLNWSDALQLAHFALSAFVVFSIMRPRVTRLAHTLSRWLYFGIYRLNAVTVTFTSPLSYKKRHNRAEKFREGAQKLRKLGNGRVIARAVEERVFREALGIGSSISGLILTLLSLIRLPERHEHWRLERRVYTRLAELVALDAKSSIALRLQIFICAFRFNYGCSSTATELATLALVIYPIWRRKAIALWEAALARAHGRCSSPSYIYKPYETFVLESMYIDEAALRIQRFDKNEGSRIVTLPHDDGVCRVEISKHRDLASPLAALARQAVQEHIRTQAERIFLQVTSGEQVDSADMSRDSESSDIDRLFVAGRYLEPPTVALMDTFEWICNSKMAHRSASVEAKYEGEALEEWEDLTGIQAELQALLDGITLSRGNSTKFADRENRSSGSENPALISQRDARRCLDSSAFNRTDALREARNRVLDVLAGK